MIANTVKINGAPLNLSADHFDNEPTALDGLSISWGRTSIVDQPETSTLSMDIALPTAQAAAMVDTITVGSTVEVTAVQTDPIPPLLIIKDATHRTVTGATVTGGPEELRLTVIDSSCYVTLRPAAWLTSGRWTNTERVRVAADYLFTADLSVTTGYVVSIRPVFHTSAVSTDPVEYGDWQEIPYFTGTQSVALTLRPDRRQIGKWISLEIEFAANSSWSGVELRLTNPKLTRLTSTSAIADVFTGRITDTHVQYNQRLDRPVLQVIAADVSAPLSNTRIGGDPWPKETATKRVERILTAAGSSQAAEFLGAPSTLQLAAVDIDSQPAWALLQGVADSTGTILWIADTLWYEDPSNRASLYRFTVPTTGPAYLEVSAAAAVKLPAGVFDRNSARVQRNPGDVATEATVRWADLEARDGEMVRVDREVTVHNHALAAQIGVHQISVSTDLTTAAAAQDLAGDLLALAAPAGFFLTGLTWDTRVPQTDAAQVITALDARARIGLPLIITNVPEWVPGSPALPVYLEGGNYTYQRGRWILDLITSKTSLSAPSIAWADLPAALTWARLSDLTWDQISSATL